MRRPPSALRPPDVPPPAPPALPTSASPPAGVARVGLALGRQGGAAAVASPLIGGARGAGCPRGHGGPQLRGDQRGAAGAGAPGGAPARGGRPAQLWRHGGEPPPRSSAPRRAAPRRTAPHRTAPHRAAPRRTAPHRTLQVLLERLADRSSSALHRTAAVTALTALLHQPRGMALFVDIPGGAAGATPAAAGDDAAAAPQSGYQRVLRALAAPLPGPMQQPVRAVCSLVALWDVAVQLRDACQQARRTRTHHTHAPHAHRRAPPAPSARGLFAPWPRPDRASACSRRRRVCVPTRRPCSPVTRPPPPCSRPSARWGAS